MPTHGGQSGRTAVQSPAAIVGVTAALVVAATVAWLAVATLVPRPPVPHPGRAVVPLSVAAFGLVVLKLLVSPEGLINGAWLSLALGAALLAVAASPFAASSRRRA